MSTPTIEYVREALKAIVDDVLKRRVHISMADEIETLFDPRELDAFQSLVCEEFELTDMTLFESVTSFRELAALVVDEIS